MCGVPLREGIGVAAGVGGSEKPRPRVDGRRSGGSWIIGGGFLGRGRRKVLHSMQEQEMFSLERGMASILTVGGVDMFSVYWRSNVIVWRDLIVFGRLSNHGVWSQFEGCAVPLFVDLYASRRLSHRESPKSWTIGQRVVHVLLIVAACLHSDCCVRAIIAGRVDVSRFDRSGHRADAGQRNLG